MYILVFMTNTGIKGTRVSNSLVNVFSVTIWVIFPMLVNDNASLCRSQKRLNLSASSPSLQTALAAIKKGEDLKRLVLLQISSQFPTEQFLMQGSDIGFNDSNFKTKSAASFFSFELAISPLLVLAARANNAVFNGLHSEHQTIQQ